ncbi:hypothetical protein OTK49_01965 [Vibrio coralliirubri]|uniref:hypothetical protein n=1 Tax=Vibrio coralliirubri TaxID=1516159 RepID=UPI00228411C8|nr:hypothetical protein [Vibrio coralliirubri]MCY9861280.1 hypothetical protein [Vibrio coralliirubri]
MKLLPVVIVTIGIFIATPATKVLVKSEALGVSGKPTWVDDFRRIDELSSRVRSTIHPTLFNSRKLVYDSSSYDEFRMVFGKPKDWMDGMSSDGETFRQRIEKQVDADAKAVANLITTIELTATSQVSRGQYKVTDYVINQTDSLKFDSKYLSRDLAVIAADPLQAAIAFHNKRYFHGVLPANYIFNSHGKYTLKRELNMTSNHLLQYHEYWFGFIFVDDFFSRSVTKIRKQVNNFKYIK